MSPSIRIPHSTSFGWDKGHDCKTRNKCLRDKIACNKFRASDASCGRHSIFCDLLLHQGKISMLMKSIVCLKLKSHQSGLSIFCDRLRDSETLRTVMVQHPLRQTRERCSVLRILCPAKHLTVSPRDANLLGG